MLWKLLLIVALNQSPFVASETSPSMFLHSEAYDAVIQGKSSLVCPYKKFTTNQHAEAITRTYDKHTIILTLDASKGTIVQRRRPLKSTDLLVAVDTHYIERVYGNEFYTSTLTPFISSYEMTGPESLLCFEMALLTNEIDVIMPVWTDPPIALTRYHSVSVLEEHFGVPFIMPSGAI